MDTYYLSSIFLVFEYVEHDLAGLIDNMKTPFTGRFFLFVNSNNNNSPHNLEYRIRSEMFNDTTTKGIRILTFTLGNS